MEKLFVLDGLHFNLPDDTILKDTYLRKNVYTGMKVIW